VFLTCSLSPANGSAASPLTEPPPQTPPLIEGTPPVEDEVAKKSPKKKGPKKQIVDSVIELDDGPGLRPGRNGQMESQPKRDLSGILAEQRFLPQSRTVMRLMGIREDPLSHFFPTKATPNGTFLYTGPAWLNPKLAELYLQPVTNLSAKRAGRFDDDQGAHKKPRLENDNEAEVEMPRDGSVAPSLHGSDAHARMSMGPDMNMDFGDMGGMEFDQGMDFSTGPLEGIPEDRLSTPGADLGVEGESYSDATCKIGMFDHQLSQLPENETTGTDQTSAGFSKNTRKAISFLKKELDVLSSQPGDNTVHFADVSQKVSWYPNLINKHATKAMYQATRRAAASFFFELLVLGTKDCVHVRQSKPFSNIEITGKAKLWNQQGVFPSQSL
jgi:cohesin complex subunit SCC1